MSNSATMLTPDMPRLLIVDGHSYAYRAFFAIRRLNSPTGEPTNAIYGFIRMLSKVRMALKPKYVAVIWDGGLAEKRLSLLPEYKAQRVEMPQDLAQQFDQIVAYLNAVGVSSWVKEGVEADDCIAALTEQAVGKGTQVVIATSDKDFMQLVSDKVFILNPNEKSESLVDGETVERKTGVGPGQIVDWLSLVGDSVDNIPGVKGVGPKTAAQLLKQFHSIDDLYRRLNEVGPDRLRTNLINSADLVRRNQELVRLDKEVPCELKLDDLQVRACDRETLRRLYAKWGFRTLLAELDQAEAVTGDFFDQGAS